VTSTVVVAGWEGEGPYYPVTQAVSLYAVVFLSEVKDKLGC
jgi:hypothetical protein